jgi:hypothetical protein
LRNLAFLARKASLWQSYCASVCRLVAWLCCCWLLAVALRRPRLRPRQQQHQPRLSPAQTERGAASLAVADALLLHARHGRAQYTVSLRKTMAMREGAGGERGRTTTTLEGRPCAADLPLRLRAHTPSASHRLALCRLHLAPPPRKKARNLHSSHVKSLFNLQNIRSCGK